MLKPRLPKNAPVDYPTHRVLGAVRGTEDAEALVAHLTRMGLGPDLWLLDRSNVAAALDAEGEQRGFWHGLARALQQAGSYEQGQLAQYEQAAAAGGWVIGVDVAQDPARRDEVASLFARHGGHHVRYFGPLAVENLHLAPSAL